MQVVISETTRRAYPQLTSALHSVKQAETFTEYCSRKGIPLPKPRSVKHYNAAVRRQGDRPKKFPDNKSFANRVIVERQSPLWYQDVPDDVSDGQQFSSRGLTDWYVGEFCKLNHLKG